MPGIYEGLRVLELADIKAMYCGKLLAGLGAEVIKVERPGGDESRRVGPFAETDGPDEEKSLSFAYFNTGKKSITLDYTTEEGAKLFRKLVRTADVVIETFSPGEMDQWGIGYETLKEINPAIIMLSVTPFGQTGPMKDWKASSDLIVDAMYGTMGDVAYKGSAPLHVGFDVQASLASLYGLFSIQAAWQERMRTGEGDHIDLAQSECFVAWRSQMLGNVQVRQENLPFMDPEKHVRQGLVNCKDGFAFVMIGGKWNELLAWFQEMGQDISDLQDEFYQAHIREVLTPWDAPLLKHFNELGQHYTKTEFMEEGQRRHIPAGAVETPDALLQNKQFSSRGLYVEVDHPVIGKYLYPGAPVILERSPYVTGIPAPCLGADNEQIFKELGFGAEELGGFSERGII